MKKYLIFVFILQFYFVVSAQKDVSDISNSEAIPFSEMDYDGKYYTFTIEEKYVGEFEEDPIKFLNTYFDGPKFINKVLDRNISSVEMDFRTSTGGLKATLDKNGEIERTFHECQDLLLPKEVRKEIYRDYKGWTMVENNHIAKGKAGKIDKEFYKIKLVKDGEVKKVNIHLDKKHNKGIAGH